MYIIINFVSACMKVHFFCFSVAVVVLLLHVPFTIFRLNFASFYSHWYLSSSPSPQILHFHSSTFISMDHIFVFIFCCVFCFIHTKHSFNFVFVLNAASKAAQQVYRPSVEVDLLERVYLCVCVCLCLSMFESLCCVIWR